MRRFVSRRRFSVTRRSVLLLGLMFSADLEFWQGCRASSSTQPAGTIVYPCWKEYKRPAGSGSGSSEYYPQDRYVIRFDRNFKVLLHASVSSSDAPELIREAWELGPNISTGQLLLGEAGPPRSEDGDDWRRLQELSGDFKSGRDTFLHLSKTEFENAEKKEHDLRHKIIESRNYCASQTFVLCGSRFFAWLLPRRCSTAASRTLDQRNVDAAT